MSYYDLDENSPTIRHPKGLKVKLRPHQLTSICAMRELEKQGTIVVDKPDMGSGLYHTVKFRLSDIAEFTGSTFVIETNSAILADKVGSGKTYMIIGLILNAIVPDVHDRFIIGTDHFSIKMMSVKDSESVNLIVVPHNLANQWASFMHKSKLSYLKLNTTNDFDVFFDTDYVTNKNPVPGCPLVLYNICRKKNFGKNKIDGKSSGSKTTKALKTGTIYERKILNAAKIKKVLESTDAIILNINRYKLFKQIFRSTKWARVIIDEMDSAQIPSMFDEYGNFNWFLTATPTAIFYKSCRRYVNKIFGYNQHLLNYFIVKNSEAYVDSSIILPKPHVFMIDTLLQRVVSAIQDLIPQDVLQLINAGNMREAVARLNCDIDTEENIVKVLTDKINKELHNLTKELEYVESLIPADLDAHEKRIQKLKTDISRCKTRLDTVKERISSINDECCFICAEEFDTPTILDCCKSVFCLKCLLSALKAGSNKCPYCRHVIKNNKEYHIISSKASPKEKIVEKKFTGKKFGDLDKPDVLEKILSYISKHDDSPKILIFSDYSQTFDKIVKNIAKANLQYALLSGIPAHITNVINEFNAGITNILMLDSKHYGSGLNLQAANYLILYHRMTPELETQVIGRAQRFGRKEALKIIYLVNESENHLTKLTTNPHRLEADDELWMITDPPPQQNVEEENVDEESDEEAEKGKSTDDQENKQESDKPTDVEDDNTKIKSKKKPKEKSARKSKTKSITKSKTKSKSETRTGSKSKSKTATTKKKNSSGSKTSKKNSNKLKATKKSNTKSKTRKNTKKIDTTDNSESSDDIVIVKDKKKSKKYVDV